MCVCVCLYKRPEHKANNSRNDFTAIFPTKLLLFIIIAQYVHNDFSRRENKWVPMAPRLVFHFGRFTFTRDI